MAALGVTRPGRGTIVSAAAWRATALVALLLTTGCDAPGSGAPATNGPSASGPEKIDPGGATSTASASYSDRIRPMLEQPCLGCHGRFLPQAGLSMASREGLVEGGRSGPAIVPGDSTKGWLMHTLTVDSGKYRMPPEGPRLSESQIDVIRQWIDAGAP